MTIHTTGGNLPDTLGSAATSYGIGGGALSVGTILTDVNYTELMAMGGVILLIIRILHDGTRLWRYWREKDNDKAN